MWTADVYRCALNAIDLLKPLHSTANKPRKLVDKLLKWLNCTQLIFIPSAIAQSQTKILLLYLKFIDISINR